MSKCVRMIFISHEKPTLGYHWISVSALAIMLSPRTAYSDYREAALNSQLHPFTKLESSEAKYSAADAISSGCPIVLRGIRAPNILRPISPHRRTAGGSHPDPCAALLARLRFPKQDYAQNALQVANVAKPDLVEFTVSRFPKSNALFDSSHFGFTP
jgi:hypothetical protein